jgi:hypothetical protein
MENGELKKLKVKSEKACPTTVRWSG